MDCGRRNFLSSIGLIGAVPLLSSLEQSANDAAIEQATIDFWSEVRQPSRPGSRGLFTPKTKLIRRAAFLLYSKDNGFQHASDLGDDGLIPTGDVGVVLRVDSFRPSTADRASLGDSKCCSLRVDLQQASPWQGLPEPLSWTAIASVLQDRKFNDYRDFMFDPKSSWGRLHTVPLPEGMGFWTWNTFIQKQEGLWGRIMESFGKVQDVVGVLGLPGVAQTALQAIDGLISFLQAHGPSEWVLQSLDMPVYATRAARTKIPGRALPLRKGDYVVLPEEHVSLLLDHKELELNDGLIVPRGTPDSDLKSAAQQTLPQISYFAFSVVISLIKPAA